MKCDRCGKEIPDTDLYCGRCGKAVFPEYMDETIDGLIIRQTRNWKKF